MNKLLDRYLRDLEERIDPAVEEDLLSRWVNFTEGNFSGSLFSPKRERPIPPQIEWPEVKVNETLDDFDKMALGQFKACSDLLAAGGGSLLAVRANYGTGIIPSLFGAELFVMEEELDTLPTTRPLKGGKEAIRRLIDRGIPDLEQGLGGKVFEMGRRFCRIGERYPRIGKYVRLYHPDTQGPMDICELLWGSDLFLDVIEEPQLVHRLLELVTETYIAFMKKWEENFPFWEEDYEVHWGLLHGGNIMLRDDSAMNFSPQFFDEFIKPYDERLLREFDGGALHFCGRGDHYIESASTMAGLHAINMSQPDYNDMEPIYSHTVDKGINIVGLSREEALRAVGDGRDLRSLVHCPAGEGSGLI